MSASRSIQAGNPASASFVAILPTTGLTRPFMSEKNGKWRRVVHGCGGVRSCIRHMLSPCSMPPAQAVLASSDRKY